MTAVPPTAEPSSGNSTTVRPLRRRRIPVGLRLIGSGLRSAGRLSPDVASDLAFRLWFRTGPKPRLAPDAVATLAQSCRHTIPGPIPAAGYSWGSGPTVLLVHGWGGSAGQFAGFVRPLTGLGFRVAAVDLPAHGASRGSRTNVFEAAATVAAAAHHWGPVHGLVTHSFGTLAALVAFRRGLRVGRVVTLAPSILPDTLVGGFSAFLGLGPEVTAGLRERLLRFAGADFWDDLSQPHPALIVHDVDDQESGLANADALWQAWPDSTLFATRGLGHYRVLRDPAVIGETARFLAKGFTPAEAEPRSA